MRKQVCRVVVKSRKKREEELREYGCRAVVRVRRKKKS